MSRIHDAIRKVEQHEAASTSEVWTNTLKVGDHSTAARTHHSIATKEVPHAPTPSDSDALLNCRSVSWTLDKASMMDFDDVHSTRASEEFRMLRSRLYQVRSTQPLRSIVVTSAVRGEGKSFVAANLWQALALHADRNVLLVDADLRAPRLHKVLGAALKPGLSECLEGKAEPEDALQRQDDRNSFFLPSGDSWPRSSDLISDGKVAGLINRLVNSFDWVIIDAPSTIETSDSSCLADIADGVLLVVRANATPSDVVQMALERLDEDRLLGVVLNEIGEPQAEQQPGSSGGRYDK